jgi:hypothetical protein
MRALCLFLLRDWLRRKILILYFSILLHCIIQWVCFRLRAALLCWFSLFHYMFRPTWPSSSVYGILFSYVSRFCFAAFFAFFHVVTLCMFPSVGWVKYEVLLFAVYAIFGTVICVFFYLLVFFLFFFVIFCCFLACVFVCLLFLFFYYCI